MGRRRLLLTVAVLTLTTWQADMVRLHRAADWLVAQPQLGDTLRGTDVDAREEALSLIFLSIFGAPFALAVALGAVAFILTALVGAVRAVLRALLDSALAVGSGRARSRLPGRHHVVGPRKMCRRALGRIELCPPPSLDTLPV